MTRFAAFELSILPRTRSFRDKLPKKIDDGRLRVRNKAIGIAAIPSLTSSVSSGKGCFEPKHRQSSPWPGSIWQLPKLASGPLLNPLASSRIRPVRGRR